MKEIGRRWKNKLTEVGGGKIKCKRLLKEAKEVETLDDDKFV